MSKSQEVTKIGKTAMFYEPLKKDNAVCVIVDGYNNGRFFAPYLNNLGYQCIHVQSTHDPKKDYVKTFIPQDYVLNMVFTGFNLQYIIDELKTYNAQHLLVGAESGVEFADLLSERLGLISNGTAKSEARRNKFKMIEALKEKKLQSVEHIKSDKLDEILAWSTKQASWPIVIKPLKSAGSEHVFFCHSTHEITDAFQQILGNKDSYGKENLEVLAETYLDGTQYLVNMVSVQGQHILSDLWELVKKEIPGGRVVHDYQRLLPSSFHLKDELVAYTRNVLDALEIKHGASHNEVFATKNGPTLVESGARIMGAINPNLISECVGRSQLELTLASHLQPEKLTEVDMHDYTLKKHLWAKMLISNQSGLIKKINFLDEIKSLPSFKGIALKVEIGQLVEKTVDLLSIPGIVYLCHEHEQVVQNDYEKIAALELEMFEV